MESDPVSTHLEMNLKKNKLNIQIILKICIQSATTYSIIFTILWHKRNTFCIILNDKNPTGNY